MFQSFIGLEIHIQLLTETKVFCGCKASFGDEPNTNICPVCMGYPGVLPALNEEAIRMAYVVAMALNCEPNEYAIFERKNYFYPDLPKNYQISQFRSPVGRNGYLDLEYRQQKKRVRIREVHLEEDAGKMIHAGDISLLDFNRAGTPLLEIVTMPDLEVGEEAEAFLQNFRRIVRYLGVCDGNMEEGSLRCDANVSVNLRGKGLGSKVEIKNLNSFKFVRKALNFEIERQTEILERGGSVTQETRLWNENRDLTESMRVKESESDYRYFPDPDLPPFRPDENFLKEVKERLVELPEERKKRLMEKYGLSKLQADFICEEKETADFFEETVNMGADPRVAAIWLASDVQKMLNKYQLSISDSPLKAKRFARLLELLSARKIHGKIAKQVLQSIFEENRSPDEIIEKNGWEQITDRSEIRKILKEVADKNPEIVKQIRSGETKPVQYLIGLIMKETAGRVEPGILQEVIREEFAFTLVRVISMGGAITGEVSEDGTILPGDPAKLISRIKEKTSFNGKIKIEEFSVNRILSEEINPEDWAVLISTIANHIQKGDTNGIVIAHGTDTLSYTASLIFWLFPSPGIPIVFTASYQPPATKEDIRGEAFENLSGAISKIATLGEGIYVYLDGKILSPLNLKFERIGTNGFTNWNLEKPVFSAKGMTSYLSTENFSRDTLLGKIREAQERSFIIKVYPGLKGDTLIRLMDAGIRHFILEVYDTGTANLRESPFSLRKAFNVGKERGINFYCTSQQRQNIDFSRYITSHELWKEGAIPMGALTTESVYTRLIASYILSQSEEEIVKIMEDTGAYTGF